MRRPGIAPDEPSDVTGIGAVIPHAPPGVPTTMRIRGRAGLIHRQNPTSESATLAEALDLFPVWELARDLVCVRYLR